MKPFDRPLEVTETRDIILAKMLAQNPNNVANVTAVLLGLNDKVLPTSHRLSRSGIVLEATTPSELIGS